MVQAIAAGTLTPIVCVSTKKEVGLKELMDLLANGALPPDAIPRQGTKDGDTVTLKPDPTAPLAAQVFKTRIDPFVHRLSFLRIFSGTLHKDATIDVAGAQEGLKSARYWSVQGERHGTDRRSRPWRNCCNSEVRRPAYRFLDRAKSKLPPLKFPTPMVGLAVAPKTRGDEAKLSGAFTKSPKKTQRFISSTIPKPRRWC